MRRASVHEARVVVSCLRPVAIFVALIAGCGGEPPLAGGDVGAREERLFEPSPRAVLIPIGAGDGLRASIIPAIDVGGLPNSNTTLVAPELSSGLAAHGISGPVTTTSTNMVCGDGAKHVYERCDGRDLGGETCRSLGFTRGQLACTSDCSFDTTGCEACGDGALSGTEECDGSDLGGASCEDLGFDGGSLSCTASCTLDVSGCSVCGDGRIGEDEECEGTELAGASCQSLGYAGGTLGCSACRLDTSRCGNAGGRAGRGG